VNTTHIDQGGRKLRASIIIPVFGTEAYLGKCLESLVNQTRQDFEVIVVDDCSPGDAEPIVDTFRRHLAIKYVRHSSNLGLLSTRFTGPDHASGDYIGFLDSDDTAHPRFVELLLSAAEATRADIVGSGRTPKQAFPPLQGTEALIEAYADSRLGWSVWSKFYRKKLVLSLVELRRISYAENIVNAEDLAFNIFCALKGPSYSHVAEVLVHYNHDRVGSISNPKSSEERRRSFQTSLRVYEIISEVAADYTGHIETIISNSAKYGYQSLMIPGDEQDFAWALSCLRRSPVGALVMSTLLEHADELRTKCYDQLTQSITKSEHAIAKLEHKLATERDKSAQLKHKLDRRNQLRPILGDLWRWSRLAAKKQS
jgi:glycosyltransferase involved in cell wall biosynthesis